MISQSSSVKEECMVEDMLHRGAVSPGQEPSSEVALVVSGDICVDEVLDERAGRRATTGVDHVYTGVGAQNTIIIESRVPEISAVIDYESMDEKEISCSDGGYEGRVVSFAADMSDKEPANVSNTAVGEDKLVTVVNDMHYCRDQAERVQHSNSGTLVQAHGVSQDKVTKVRAAIRERPLLPKRRKDGDQQEVSTLLTFTTSEGKSAKNNDHRQRMRWTKELRLSFKRAVRELGGVDRATPKRILKAMAAPGLSLWQVKSFLQKYRLTQHRDSIESDEESTGDEEQALETGSPVPEAGEPECDEAEDDEGQAAASKRQKTDAIATKAFEVTLKMQMQVMKEVQTLLEEQCQMQAQIEAQHNHLLQMLAIQRTGESSSGPPTTPKQGQNSLSGGMEGADCRSLQQLAKDTACSSSASQPSPQQSTATPASMGFVNHSLTPSSPLGSPPPLLESNRLPPGNTLLDSGMLPPGSTPYEVARLAPGNALLVNNRPPPGTVLKEEALQNEQLFSRRNTGCHNTGNRCPPGAILFDQNPLSIQIPPSNAGLAAAFQPLILSHFASPPGIISEAVHAPSPAASGGPLLSPPTPGMMPARVMQGQVSPHEQQGECLREVQQTQEREQTSPQNQALLRQAGLHMHHQCGPSPDADMTHSGLFELPDFLRQQQQPFNLTLPSTIPPSYSPSPLNVPRSISLPSRPPFSTMQSSSDHLPHFSPVKNVPRSSSISHPGANLSWTPVTCLGRDKFETSFGNLESGYQPTSMLVENMGNLSYDPTSHAPPLDTFSSSLPLQLTPCSILPGQEVAGGLLNRGFPSSGWRNPFLNQVLEPAALDPQVLHQIQLLQLAASGELSNNGNANQMLPPVMPQVHQADLEVLNSTGCPPEHLDGQGVGASENVPSGQNVERHLAARDLGQIGESEHVNSPEQPSLDPEFDVDQMMMVTDGEAVLAKQMELEECLVDGRVSHNLPIRQCHVSTEDASQIMQPTANCHLAEQQQAHCGSQVNQTPSLPHHALSGHNLLTPVQIEQLLAAQSRESACCPGNAGSGMSYQNLGLSQQGLQTQQQVRREQALMLLAHLQQKASTDGCTSGELMAALNLVQKAAALPQELGSRQPFFPHMQSSEGGSVGNQAAPGEVVLGELAGTQHEQTLQQNLLRDLILQKLTEHAYMQLLKQQQGGAEQCVSRQSVFSNSNMDHSLNANPIYSHNPNRSQNLNPSLNPNPNPDSMSPPQPLLVQEEYVNSLLTTNSALGGQDLETVDAHDQTASRMLSPNGTFRPLGSMPQDSESLKLADSIVLDGTQDLAGKQNPALSRASSSSSTGSALPKAQEADSAAGGNTTGPHMAASQGFNGRNLSVDAQVQSLSSIASAMQMLTQQCQQILLPHCLANGHQA